MYSINGRVTGHVKETTEFRILLKASGRGGTEGKYAILKAWA